MPKTRDNSPIRKKDFVAEEQRRIEQRKCDYKHCSGVGGGGGKCKGEVSKGDDFDMYHCVECGDLSWVGKGNSCERCGDHYCAIDWQHTFLFFDECQETTPPFDEGICPKCFLKDQTLWCTKESCNCNQKEPEQREKYAEHIAQGRMCADIDLERNETDKESYVVYRFPRENKARLKIKTEDSPIEYHGEYAVAEACLEARERIAKKLAQGFTIPHGWLGSNAYGYFDGLKPKLDPI